MWLQEAFVWAARALVLLQHWADLEDALASEPGLTGCNFQFSLNVHVQQVYCRIFQRASNSQRTATTDIQSCILLCSASLPRDFTHPTVQ